MSHSYKNKLKGYVAVAAKRKARKQAKQLRDKRKSKSFYA